MSDSRRLDQESRRIAREELQTNLLVEAGAGSGKTQMLAERMAAGIASGVYEIDRMAAVTFTRKAGSELRGRFHLALEAELQRAIAALGPQAAGNGDRPARRANPYGGQADQDRLTAREDSGDRASSRSWRPAARTRPRSAVRPPEWDSSGEPGELLSPLPEDDAGSNAVARLENALANLERFFAGTIHSFCARLLRERPVESGVSPGFTELDEVLDLELRKRVWRDFVAMARSQGDPDMMALLAADVRPKDLDTAFATICLHDDVVFPAGDAEPPDAAPAVKALEAFWKELQAHLPDTIDPETTCKIQQKAMEFPGRYRVARLRLDRPSVVASLLGIWDIESKITQNRWAESNADKKRINGIVVPLHQAFRNSVVKPYLAQWRAYVYRLSVTLLTKAREHARTERRRQNTLNYGDLLILTANVLRGNAEVRRSLQEKYRHLFVDEFQDTDPIQAEIVFLLGADESGLGTHSARSDVGAPPAAVASGGQLSRSANPDSGGRTALRGPDGPLAASSVSWRGAQSLLARSGDPDRPDLHRDSPHETTHLHHGRDHLSSDGAATDWRSVPLRPGALFVVGDPKQSIYRFRRADIDIYNIVRNRFSDPAVGRVLPLTMNFRSVPSLCTWANDVFRTVFPAEPTTYAPKFSGLDASRVSEEVAEGRQAAGLFTLTHTDKASAHEDDAARIAWYIRFEVNAGRRSFSDFLILTRRKKGRIAPYATALEALNIPIEVSGAGAFGDSPEVKALITLLRALSDPQDALALVAVLRGPLFGISDPELFAYKQSGGWFQLRFGHGDADARRGSGTEAPSYRATNPGSGGRTASLGITRDSPEPGRRALRGPDRPLAASSVSWHGSPSLLARSGEPGRPDLHRDSSRGTSELRERPPGVKDDPGRPATERVAAALTVLADYHRWTRILPAAAALERILEHSGYLALASTTPGGVEAGDVVHAVDRVRRVVEEGGSLADAADSLEEDGDESNEVESLPLEPGKTNVVRVMNLHKAKGLESEVVFLADPLGGYSLKVDEHIRRQGDQAVGWFKVVKATDKPWLAPLLGQPADWDQYEAEEELYREAEEHRLLYVAATRAREMLVVSRLGDKSPAWGDLARFLGTAQELVIPDSVTVPVVVPADTSEAAEAAFIAASGSAHVAARQSSWSISSVTAETRHIARITRSEDASADDPTKVVGTDTPAHRADAGAAWGTLIHGLLEHAMRHPNATREDLRRLAMWLTVEEPQLRVAIDQAIDTVQRVATAEFWAQAKAGVHFEETPFIVAHGTDLMAGVIDLLYESGGGWHVRDYKTDVSLEPSAYAGQLKAYRLALGAVKCRVVDADLVHVRDEEL